MHAILRWLWNQVTFKRVVFALLAVPLAVYLWAQARRPVIILDLISVPKQFADAGLTSEVVTQRVRERLEEIRKTNEAASPRDPLSVASDQTYPNIEIPETKLSLQVVVDSLRRVLNTSPKHISGEITFDQQTSSIDIRCRMTRLGELLKVGNERRFGKINSEQAIEVLGEDLTELTDPYLLGIYFDIRKEILSAQRVADNMFLSQPDTEHLYAKAHLLLAYIASDNGRPKEAIAEGEKAIALDPEWWYAHYCEGGILEDQNILDESAAEYRIAIKLNPEDRNPYNDLGNVLSDQDRFEEAANKYRYAIKLGPQYPFAHNNLGAVLWKQGQLDEATAEYRTVIRLDPKRAYSHYGLATVLRDLHKLDEATAEYRTAIQLDPKGADPHNGMGDVLCGQHKLDEAAVEYRIAIQLDPTTADPHTGMGNILRDQHKLDEAAAEYRTAIQLNSKDADPHYNFGAMLKAMGKADEAKKELELAHELGPERF